MNVNTPLHTLYQTLNPQADPRRDGQQLRADSSNSALRLKARKALFSSQSGRTNHIFFARVQVAAAIDASIESLAKSRAVTPETLRTAVDPHFDRGIASGSRPLFLRTVKKVIDTLDGTVLHSRSREMRGADRSTRADAKALLAGLRATPDALETLREERIDPLPLPHEPTAAPAMRAAANDLPIGGSARSVGRGQVHIHRKAKPVPAQSVPLALAHFETKSVSGSQSTRSVTVHPTPAVSKRAIAWQTKLLRRYAAETMRHLAPSLVAHFHQKLKELATFADRVYPAELKETGPMPLPVLRAAAHLKVGEGCRPDHALYLQLRGSALERRTFSMLSEPSKRVFMPV